MAYPYIVQADLEARVSPIVVQRILDDTGVGSPDASALTRILKDASAKVAGYLRGVYDLTALAAAPPEEVKRLTLDVAEVYLFRRFPEYARGDWAEMLKAVDRELTALRRGDTRLDVAPPADVPSNTGGEVSQGNPSTFSETQFEPVFNWGTGDF